MKLKKGHKYILCDYCLKPLRVGSLMILTPGNLNILNIHAKCKKRYDSLESNEATGVDVAGIWRVSKKINV